MDLLSPRQSALLHSLEKQIRDDYLRLTPEDEEAVLFLIKLKYISVFEYDLDYDANTDDFRQIPTAWGLSELGRTYLENERIALEHEQKYKEELMHLRRIADKAQEAAMTADIDARRSRRIAWMSALIALGTLALEVVQFIV